MNIQTAIIACAVCVASTATWAQETDVRLDEPDQMPIEDLKSAYLSCDRASAQGRLPRAGIMQCSIIYEALKQRAFDGDFDKLLAWSRTNPSTEH